MFPIEVEKSRLIAVAGGLALFGSGALTGYFYAHHKLQKSVDRLLNDELKQIRDHYAEKLNSRIEEKPSLDEVYEKTSYVESLENYSPSDEKTPVAKAVAEVMQESKPYAGKPVEAVEEDPEEEDDIPVVKPGTGEIVSDVKNVFEEGPPTDYRTTREIEYEGWDYENERARRAGTKIYIITQEEFFTNEPNHTNASLTYFEGDDVLADEADVPIEDLAQCIGTERNLKFGHGSSDPNIVHIRNETLEHDFEITKSEGKFAEEVFGIIEHDAGHRKPRKARWDDE